MPPELEGSSIEVVVLADQFFIEGHGNSYRSKVKSQMSKVRSKVRNAKLPGAKYQVSGTR
jgi:hypothetical protein